MVADWKIIKERKFMLVKTAAWNILIRKSKGFVFCIFVEIQISYVVVVSADMVKTGYL